MSTATPVTNTHDIVRAVAAHFAVTPSEITGSGRTRAIAFARHVVCYLALRLLRVSTVDVGRAIRRDHTTVGDGARRVKALLAEGDLFAVAHVTALEEALSEPAELWRRALKGRAA